MWVRKSEAQIEHYLNQQEARRKSLLRPFLFAIGLTVVSLIMYSLGYRGGWLRVGIVIVSSPLDSPVGLVLPGVGLFIFFFAFFLYRQRRPRTVSHHASDSLLCRGCKQPSLNTDPSGLCQCGGKLEPFAFYNWVEDAEPKPA